MTPDPAPRKKFLIVHGHFYQPPRENPWLEVIEKQPFASPWHDWNERIAAECYTPNTMSRVLDADSRIDEIVNNFEYLSFNLGPTLALWLEDHAPSTYRRIIDADRASARRIGHGNAIALAYNHPILPLCSPDDRALQIARGVLDFQDRYGRAPEGMWLPETAANDATFRDLVSAGLRFTILSPDQPLRVRRIGGARWQDVSDGRIDVRRPYRWFWRTEEGERDETRFLDLFFLSRELSSKVSFQHVCTKAEGFAAAVEQSFDPDNPQTQVVVLATDGETFGHHEPFADMCLAYFFRRLMPRMDLDVTNLAAFLAAFPPSWEVELKPGKDGLGTSWSCPHGVSRWRENCGCGRSKAASDQTWRAPLRKGISDLRATVSQIVRDELALLVKDPSAARTEYIRLVRDRSQDPLDDFVKKHLLRSPSHRDISRVLTALEADHVSMLSLTSCGWFFDEISRYEPVQNMMYALRACHLIARFRDDDATPALLSALAAARSNVPAFGNGKTVFEKLVLPSVFDVREAVGAHAISKLLLNDARSVGRYRFLMHQEAENPRAEDRALVGLVKVTSRVTRESGRFAYFAGRTDLVDVRAYVREVSGRAEYDSLLENLDDSPSEALPALMESRAYGWGDIPGEVKRPLLSVVLKESRHRLDRELERLYEESRDLVEILAGAGMDIPAELAGIVSGALSARLARELHKARGRWMLDEFAEARAVVRKARELAVKLDLDEVTAVLTEDFVAAAQAFRDQPSADNLQSLVSILEIADALGLALKKFLAENIVLEVLEGDVMKRIEALPAADPGARAEIHRILDLAEKMNISKRRYVEKLKEVEAQKA
ncbi:MAG: DUF3536 domain-containing protein [Planctomycetota bacterium]